MGLPVSDGKGRVSPWNDPRIRGRVFQALLLLVLAVVLYDIGLNTAHNLASRNVASGWGFLGRTAGFDIAFSIIGYSGSSSYARALLVGLLNTLLVSALGIVFATVLGFALGVMRLSRNWLASRAGAIYIDVARNVPLLLQVFIWYKLVLKPLPEARNAIRIGEIGALSNKGLTLPAPLFGDGAWMALLGLAVAIILSIIVARWAKARQMRTGARFPTGIVVLGLILLLPPAFLALAGWPLSLDYPTMGSFSFKGGATLAPEFIALLVALSTYTAAFIAEAVRAGILAVSRGQTEAARALGLTNAGTLRLIVIPQALRVIIPPLTSQYLNLTKNSSLAVAIGYPDFVSTGGTTLNQTGQAIEIVVLWMVAYLFLSLVTSAFMNWFNARARLVER